jgi:hypothetical protein
LEAHFVILQNIILANGGILASDEQESKMSGAQLVLVIHRELISLLLEEISLEEHKSASNMSMSRTRDNEDRSKVLLFKGSPQSSDFARLFSITYLKFLVNTSAALLPESKYLQMLWNSCWDLFFCTSSNPFQLQDFHVALHIIDGSSNNIHHHKVAAALSERLNCRMKLLSAMKLLSVSDFISKSSKLHSKFGLIRRERLNEIDNTNTTSFNEVDEEDNEDDFDEEEFGDHNVEEDIMLSDSARSVFKTCFSLTAQYTAQLLETQQRFNIKMESPHSAENIPSGRFCSDRDSRTSSCFFQRHFDAVMKSLEQNHFSTRWSSSQWIIGSIDKRLEDWVDWISDPTLSVFDLPQPTMQERERERIMVQTMDENSGIQSNVINPLDQIIICMALKPFLLPGLLQQLICTIGFDINNKFPRANNENRFMSSSLMFLNSGRLDERLEVISDHELLWLNRNKFDRVIDQRDASLLEKSHHDDFLSRDDDDDDDDNEKINVKGGRDNHHVEKDQYVRSGNSTVHHAVVPRSMIQNIPAYIQRLEAMFCCSPKDNLLLTLEDSLYPVHGDFVAVPIESLSITQRGRGLASLSLCLVQSAILKHTIGRQKLWSFAQSDLTSSRQTMFSLPPYDSLSGVSMSYQVPRQNKSNTLTRAGAQPGAEIVRRTKEIIDFIREYFSINHIIDCLSENIPSGEYEEIAKAYCSRTQWLLVLFHVSVEFFFSAVRVVRNGGGSARERGQEFESSARVSSALALPKTLFPAIQSILTLFKATLVTTVAEQAVTAIQDMNRPPSANGVRIRPSPTTTMLSALCTDNGVILLKEVILQTIYVPALQTNCCVLSPSDRQQLETMFNLIFTTESVNFSVPFRFLNRVLLPQENEQSQVNQFMKSLRVLACEGEASPKDETVVESDELQLYNNSDDPLATRIISETTHGSGFGNALCDFLFVRPVQLHHRALHLIDDAILRGSQIVLSMHDKLNTATLTTTTDRNGNPFTLHSQSLHNLTLLSLAPNSGGVLQAVRTTLTTVLSLLPVEIDLSEESMSQTISKQMKAHFAGQDLIGGSKLPSSGNASSLANAPAPPTGTRMTMASTLQRRPGQRAIQRIQSREYDPIWAFVLMETAQYNKAICTLKTALEQLIKFEYSDWSNYVGRTMGGAARVRSFGILGALESERNSALKDIFFRLFSGYVPTHWLSVEDSFLTTIQFVKIDAWFAVLTERRKMLLDWLEIGDPVPASAKFHLLDDPQGLFFAIRDSLAMKMDTSVDKVFLKFDVLSISSIPLVPTVNNMVNLKPTAVGSRSSSVASVRVQGLNDPKITVNQDPDVSFYSTIDNIVHTSCAGCHVYFSNVTMHNALFSGRTRSVELLPDYHASAFGSVGHCVQYVDSHITFVCVS